MTQRRALPKICIALGLPDVPRLLEQARREAEAGRELSGIPSRLPSRSGAGRVRHRRVSAGAIPNCTILATCRRHQNHGKFNGSIEEQLRILDLAIENGARAMDVEIETAEVVPGPLRGAAHARAAGDLLASLRNHAASRSCSEAHAESSRGCLQNWSAPRASRPTRDAFWRPAG